MLEDGAIDLFALSRDVDRGARHASSQKTFRALQAVSPSAHDVLLRDALLRWVHELLQDRISEELREAEREARAEPADDPEPPRTFDEARRALVTAPHRRIALLAWDRMVERAPRVAAPRIELRARRFEAARRLGLAHPFALANDVPPALARDLLDRTEPLAVDLSKRVRRHVEGEPAPADAIRAALAEDAREGWPAVLGERWLREAFPALTMPARMPRLPAPSSGSTFLRAAYAWGFALREGGTARSLPFALARDPYATSAHLFGAALAVAVADPVFQKRRLRVSSRVAEAQARSLRLSLFFALRLEAMRFVFATSERTPRDDHEELGMRVFGAPLPSALRDAWPELRRDESARFVAALRAHGFVRDLVARHDEDWFENPRAGAELAQIASGPVFDATPPEEDAAAAVARAFEEALA